MTPKMEIAGLIYHINIASGLQLTLIGLMSCASFSQPLCVRQNNGDDVKEGGDLLREEGRNEGRGAHRGR